MKLSSKKRLLLALLATGAAIAGAGDSAGAFRPGERWLDTSGAPINAHGGGVIFHRGAYYWYGQHMVAGTEGNKAQS